MAFQQVALQQAGIILIDARIAQRPETGIDAINGGMRVGYLFHFLPRYFDAGRSFAINNAFGFPCSYVKTNTYGKMIGSVIKFFLHTPSVFKCKAIFPVILSDRFTARNESSNAVMAGSNSWQPGLGATSSSLALFSASHAGST